MRGPARALARHVSPQGKAGGKILLTLWGARRERGAQSGESRANGAFAVLEINGGRPKSVMGPLGPLTLDDLPSSITTHWVSRRKAELLAAIDGGLLTVEEACGRYRLSLEELAAWRRSVDRAGIAGLRVTRLQQYRKPISD